MKRSQILLILGQHMEELLEADSIPRIFGTFWNRKARDIHHKGAMFSHGKVNMESCSLEKAIQL